MNRHQRARILITRLSAVGDCILTLPLLSALRRNLPEAYIAWATGPGPASLLAQNPQLDEIITVPQGWMGKPQSTWELVSRLRRLQFDLSLDPQSLTKSSALAWLSGAPRRVGFAAPRGRELAPWLNNVLVPVQRAHVVDHQLDLLKVLDIHDHTVEFCLPEDPAVASRTEAYLQGSIPGGRYATITPGAGWASRTWPAARFGQVAAHLGRQHGLPTLVVWAGDRERQWAEEIREFSQGSAVLAPPTTLPELAALLRRTCLFVASDTGPTHLAAAVGTTCVALFGVTRPEVSGPYGSRHEFVTSPGPISDRRHHRWASNEAMQRIEVETVCAACDRMLAQLSQAA